MNEGSKRPRPGAFRWRLLAGAGVLLVPALLAAPSLASGRSARAGKLVYEDTCSSCHDGGFKGWMTGAPEIGDYEEWEAFLDKGAAAMSRNVVTGDNGHEKKGGCEDCSAADVRAAVDYIVSKTKKPSD